MIDSLENCFYFKTDRSEGFHNKMTALFPQSKVNTELLYKMELVLFKYNKIIFWEHSLTFSLFFLLH
jgi:hypothetical protein